MLSNTEKNQWTNIGKITIGCHISDHRISNPFTSGGHIVHYYL